MLFSFFYELALYIFALLSLPKMLYSFFIHKKYRQNLWPRFGVHQTAFEDNLPSIWIHAVSVGETKAVVSLARELKCLFPKTHLIISSITETGHAEAKRSLPFADYHIYLPFDFKWAINNIVKKFSPRLVILSESDFWFNFLELSKMQGAALALVNGKISENSARNFRIVPFFAKKLFGLFDILCVQNDLYMNRMIKVGVAKEKMVVTGNLKFDDDYPQLSQEEIIHWRQTLGISSDQLVLTIGSSHPPEEQLFLKNLKEIWKNNPFLRVILVPRKPEFFKTVANLLERERIHWIKFSNINQRSAKEQVILIDTMGLLRMCYQLSDFAIVAGSFTKQVGGHNILEPCWYGKPVIFGPYMHAQIELVDLMKQYEAGIQVDATYLQTMIERWIANPNEAQKIGARGLKLINDLKGSMHRTIEALNQISDKLS